MTVKSGGRLAYNTEWNIWSHVSKSSPLGVGHLSRPGWVRDGPARRRGRSSVFQFLEVLSHDSQNILAKFDRRRRSGLGALGFLCPARRKGGSKRWFCLSVRPSVTYTANNWRTQRPSVPKFGTKVLHLWCDMHTSFKVKKSKVKVTRTINADTSAAISSERQGLRTSNLIHGCRTTTRISHRRHDLQGQRSRSQGHVISLSHLGPMLYLCH